MIALLIMWLVLLVIGLEGLVCGLATGLFVGVACLVGGLVAWIVVLYLLSVVGCASWLLITIAYGLTFDSCGLV